MQTTLEIRFAREDFEPALTNAGIDPASITDDEWRKFTDAFLAGTAWDEVAGHAAAVIVDLREQEQEREG